jgi:hypothetical protein
MLVGFSLDNIGNQFAHRAKNRWMTQIDEGSQDIAARGLTVAEFQAGLV